MERFLDNVAKQLLHKHQHQLQDVCVVLPSRRAHVFLKKALADRTEKPIFAPQIFSIEDFIFHVTHLVKADNTALLFELYSTYRKHHSGVPQTFEEFIVWGEVLLSDFNEIDHYLVDAKALFDYLGEVKTVERWNPAEGVLQGASKAFVSFYKMIAPIYTTFSQRCMEKKQVWSGLAARSLVEQPDQLRKYSYSGLYFVGFNALTAAEYKIMEECKALFNAQFFGDFDAYYADNKEHEAGHFYRHQIKPLFSDVPLSEKFKTPKEVNIVGVPQNIGQIEYVAKLVSDMYGNKGQQTMDTNKAVVVLNDNLLAMPLIASMPAEVGGYNLTMGYPFKLSPLYSFIQMWFKILLKQSSTEGKGKEAMYSLRDIEAVLLHPYIQLLYSNQHEEKRHVRAIIADADKKGLAFFSYERLKGTFLNTDTLLVLSFLFEPWEGGVDVVAHKLKKLIALLKKLFTSTSNDGRFAMDREMLFEFNNALNITNDAITNVVNDYPISARMYVKLVLRMVKSLSVPFKGEPLKGLQVMGMLETRCLDFDHVIMVSSNEGILPSNSNTPSYIPMDVRREFSLPLTTTRDAVMSYHFYRLLHYAKRVDLLYNTEADTMGGGDKSRFLTQLLIELKQYFPQHAISSFLLNETPELENRDDVISIPKTAVLKELQKLKKKGLSPSSLSMYIACPLRFCLEKLWHILPPEEAAEALDSRLMGNIIHETLEHCYTPYVTKVIKPFDIAHMMKQLDDELDRVYYSIVSDNQDIKGKNYLFKEVAKQITSSYLKSEKQRIAEDEKRGVYTTIMMLEKELSCTINFDNRGEEDACKLKGFVDRIDFSNGNTLIYDYKTGKVDKRSLLLEKMIQIPEKYGMRQLNQLLMYAYIYRNGEQYKGEPIASGIIPLVSVDAERCFASSKEVGKILDDKVLTQYEEILITILQDLFDTTGAFVQTEDEDNCKYCSFVGICGK